MALFDEVITDVIKSSAAETKQFRAKIARIRENEEEEQSNDLQSRLAALKQRSQVFHKRVQEKQIKTTSNSSSLNNEDNNVQIATKNNNKFNNNDDWRKKKM